MLLNSAGKPALDLLSDWPWMLQRDMASLMNISEGRGSHVTAILDGCGLLTRVTAASGWLALTDKGLAFLVRRDRTSVGVTRKRWSDAP